MAPWSYVLLVGELGKFLPSNDRGSAGAAYALVWISRGLRHCAAEFGSRPSPHAQSLGVSATRLSMKLPAPLATVGRANTRGTTVTGLARLRP
jgi:hypothetical protein